jgi:hypothetical protein
MKKTVSSRRRGNLSKSAAGIEGLPLTLIITMVVLAITVPMIFGSLRAYDRARVETALESEINRFTSAVQTVYIAGPGNSVAIDFHALDGSMTGVESVRFGDVPNGSFASSVRYILQSRAECVVPMSQPSVPMGADDGCALQIGSGKYKIQAECIISPTDLNGDGRLSDTCVRLRLISR